MGCGQGCARIVLIIFNLIFWLSGVAILAVGIWIRVDSSIERYIDVLNSLDDQNFIYMVAYVMIGAGCFVLIVGFFGCCGAIKQNKCMLGMYIFLLVCVLGIELAGGILAIVYKNDIKDKLKNEWGDVIKKEYEQPEGNKDPNAFTMGMDFIQVKFECCGIAKGQAAAAYANGSYIREVQKDNPEFMLPPSCCLLKAEHKEIPDSVNKVNDFITFIDGTNKAKMHDSQYYKNLDDCRKMADGSEYINTEGCFQALEDFVEDKSVILAAVGIAIALLQLFGIIIAFCLCRSVGDKE